MQKLIKISLIVCSTYLFINSISFVTAYEQCQIDPYNRTDCKIGTENDCVLSGCCWNPTWAGGPPWCFYPLGIPGNTTGDGPYVHLFEWKWNDIALECENYLGPKGFKAVQVSPPQENRVISNRPWWERYQPVSYKLITRSGNEEEFANMVKRCKAVGVDIWVDTVVNHMSGAVGEGRKEYGTAGTEFGHYSYPDFKWNDFHHNPDYSGQANCQINQADYSNNAWRVRNCDLSGLTDLNTASSYVQEKIAGFMRMLVEKFGVSGFRIDASKHMDPKELENIYKSVPDAFIFHEVIDQRLEAISYKEYTHLGHVTEFVYGLKLADVFRSGKLSSLQNFGESWGLMDSRVAMSFTDNHDNQRNHGGGGNVLTFKDNRMYELANVFMLAWPYGYAQVMSSYRFDNNDQGPPDQSVWSNGRNTCFDSNSKWVCEHRWRAIGNMAKFRRTTQGTQVTNWWSNGGNQIAFGRGDLGFVVINKESYELNTKIKTSLPPGVYCDLIHNDSNNPCSYSIQVAADGSAQIKVSQQDSVAFLVGF